ncbi:hypothetical protein RF679_03260 [Undibacterium cyanobacteriorum]|uniref:CdiI immunity protein domain-containing protein n=1 Tax=Undibacterium cyanobacteriorum TaxID=3073561 RepID=A0ABY9RKT2_9BURK|nr:hypothetical protein [Undibacterium sp. 20NA77.5]WMW81309.1 hypothetical protein RF679_03260 [Undibacterium sp. 20NA77.5]
MLRDLSEQQRALADYMSELSEAAFHAGWMEALEFELWEAVVTGPRRFGQLDISQDHILHLSELHKACGGWIRFDEEYEEIFVPTGEWLKRVAEYLTPIDPLQWAPHGAAE